MSNNSTVTKFSWHDGSISLYNSATKEAYQLSDAWCERVTQITRSSKAGIHINGGHRYKRLKSQRDIAHVRALLSSAVETNPSERSAS